MSEEIFHGVPRDKIPWYPIINREKCISCGKCVEYCKHGVFVFEEEQGKRISVIRKQNNCTVYCTGCDAICPASAIGHPSKKEIGKIISELRKTQTLIKQSSTIKVNDEPKS